MPARVFASGSSQAAGLFLQQAAANQRRLLQVVIKNASWREGELRTTMFEPIEILRHSNQESYRKGRQSAIWLPGMDSNHDSRLQRPLSYH